MFLHRLTLIKKASAIEEELSVVGYFYMTLRHKAGEGARHGGAVLIDATLDTWYKLQVVWRTRTPTMCMLLEMRVQRE